MVTLTRPKALLAAAALAAASLAGVGTHLTAAAAATCAAPDHPGGDWPRYGKDLANSRHQNAEKVIGPLQAPTLAPAWTFQADGDVTGTPIVVDGCVYVGTNGGRVYALNADTGDLVWEASVPDGGVVNGTAAVRDGRVVVAVSRSSQPYVAAYDQASGALVWKTAEPIDTQIGSDVYGSPQIFDGVVIQGVSAGSAELGDEADRYAFQGSLVLLDAATGDVLKKVWTIHPPTDDPNDFYAGASVWSTAAIDTVRKWAFVGTGNPFEPQAEHAHANAVLKIDVDPASPTFGKILDSYKGEVDEYVPHLSDLPCYDIPGNLPPYPQGVGACGDIDLDFGASPNLFPHPSAPGHALVGVGQKSGVYHVFDELTMERTWTSLVGVPTSVGGIVGSTAFDGTSLYGPVTVPGYVWSLDRNGAPRWASPTIDGAHWGNPVAVANGVVYTVDLKGFLDAYDAGTGAPLLHRPIALGADTGANPVVSWGGVSVARNTVYATVGISGLPSGFVVAFRPGLAPPAPPPIEPPDLPALPGPPGGAGGGRVVAGPGAVATTYATPIVTISAGSSLTFTNLDVVQHDVDSAVPGQFESPLVGLGQSTPVAGVADLAPGQYGFYCSLHHNMTGTLVVQ